MIFKFKTKTGDKQVGKIAFVFPGQGSQYTGMGKELADKYPAAKAVFCKADSIKQLSSLCFEGDEDELKKTTNTQPALLTASFACAEVLRAEGVRPDFVAGHSLGEYTALVVAEVLSFTDALNLVMLRSELMEDAMPFGEGTMAAVLGLSNQAVREVCQEASKLALVEPANFNCPGQVVIAGFSEGVEKALQLAKEKGAKRVIPLAVSGPFHSSLMEPVSIVLSEKIKEQAFRKPTIPIVANVTGKFACEAKDIRDNLVRQVKNPVLWEDSINYLYKAGARVFIEVGPGKVLTGLIKKVLKDVLLLNVEDEASLKNTLVRLREVI